jgi:hypothetical protein
MTLVRQEDEIKSGLVAVENVAHARHTSEHKFTISDSADGSNSITI